MHTFLKSFCVAILVLLVASLSFSCKKKKQKVYKYESFGVTAPSGYSIHGIDISRHQEHIDWKAVKDMRSEGEKISFVYMKATEGSDWKDEHFETNWAATKQSGLLRGAYHFFIPSKPALQQAYYFQEHVSLKSGDLPPVVDIEITDGKNATEIRESLAIFLKETETHYGVKPIIYTSYKYYQDYLHGFFPDYPLWVAHYKRKKLTLPEETNLAMWQYSERGRVNGIKGRVDFNVFNGDFVKLRSLCVK